MPPKRKKSKAEPLPSTKENWVKATRQAGIHNQTIHTFTPMRSASKITREQYLLLRVLWPPLKPINHFDPEKFDLGKSYKDASRFLDQFSPFLHYLESVENARPIAPFQSNDTMDLGIFDLPRHYQLEVENTDESNISQKVVVTPTSSHAQTPASRAPRASPIALHTRKKGRQLDTLTSCLSPPSALARISEQDLDVMIDTGKNPKAIIHSTSSLSPMSPAGSADSAMFPPTVGEQIVNNALVLFLQALTMKIPKIKSMWTPYPLLLKADFMTASFVARTDGYLKTMENGKVQAILEVKSRIRRKQLEMIQMQESAQMIGWVMNDKERPSPTSRGR